MPWNWEYRYSPGNLAKTPNWIPNGYHCNVVTSINVNPIFYWKWHQNKKHSESLNLSPITYFHQRGHQLPNLYSISLMVLDCQLKVSCNRHSGKLILLLMNCRDEIWLFNKWCIKEWSLPRSLTDNNASGRGGGPQLRILFFFFSKIGHLLLLMNAWGSLTENTEFQTVSPLVRRLSEGLGECSRFKALSWEAHLERIRGAAD